MCIYVYVNIRLLGLPSARMVRVDLADLELSLAEEITALFLHGHIVRGARTPASYKVLWSLARSTATRAPAPNHHCLQGGQATDQVTNDQSLSL